MVINSVYRSLCFEALLIIIEVHAGKQRENVAVISINITCCHCHAVLIMYAMCFILPQRQGSIEQNQGSMRNRSLLLANQISVFTLSIV